MRRWESYVYRLYAKLYTFSRPAARDVAKVNFASI